MYIYMYMYTYTLIWQCMCLNAVNHLSDQQQPIY